MSVEEIFKDIIDKVNNDQVVNENLTTENKLDFYKYYKQATMGDCNIPQPWSINLEAAAKWKAWDSVKGMSAEEAMKNYIELYNIITA
jgi:diazepam-binding inhibitor (GABA receptor modulating acyl-CoA-binding protein)